MILVWLKMEFLDVILRSVTEWGFRLQTHKCMLHIKASRDAEDCMILPMVLIFSTENNANAY